MTRVLAFVSAAVLAGALSLTAGGLITDTLKLAARGAEKTGKLAGRGAMAAGKGMAKGGKKGVNAMAKGTEKGAGKIKEKTN